MQNKHLPDTQNTTDIRNIVINEVGIKDILHPINFINRDQESLPSVANFTMTVRLPENVKGTHMSRFVEFFLNNIYCAPRMPPTPRPDVRARFFEVFSSKWS